MADSVHRRPPAILEEEMSADSVAVPYRGTGQTKLILSLARDGSVIQFNTECEQLTGFSRDEILRHPFTVLLAPESVKTWDDILQQVSHSLHVPQFSLPIVTKSRTQVTVLWNGFVICDSLDSLQSICLLGMPMEPNISAPDTRPQTYSRTPSSSGTSDVSKSPPVSPSEPVEAPLESQRKETQYLEEIRADLCNLNQEVSSVHQLVQTLLHTMNTQYEALAQLPAEIHTVTEHINEPVQVQTTSLLIPVKWSLKDPFGFKWREKQLIDLTHQLDERKLELDGQEERFLQERKLLDQRLEEFCQWKEKLKAVEEDIENRRQAVLNTPQNTAQHPRTEVGDEESMDYHQLLDKIPESAIIVQRGIIKQTNASFVSLMGYSTDELLEKSLFDFIAVDGLGHVEKYYLDRLKGEHLEGYSTVLSTKTDNRITVDIRIKPTLFNGEKAEILILNSSR